MQPQPSSIPTNIVYIQPELKKQFQPPTIEQVLLEAAKMGLPDVEAQKWFFYYESNGWMVGRTRMKVWKAALSGWKLRWWERQNTTSRNVEMIIRGKELTEIQARKLVISGSYSENLSWDAKDRIEYKALKERERQLKKVLGYTL